MTETLLKKEKVKGLCLSASGQWETYIPSELLGAETQFVRLDTANKKELLEKINLEYESLIVSPKTIAFSQLETLFQFNIGRIFETIKPVKKKLLFGVRACDAKGILFLNNFFSKDFEDIYYLSKAKDTLLVIVGCTHPLEHCFCTSTKTGPFLEKDFDIQLTDLGTGYLVESGSPKGERFIASQSRYFDNASKNDLKMAEAAKRKAQESVHLKLDFEKALKRFCEDKVPQQLYEKISQRCIYCGGCIYVCPTCSCFNVFDELHNSSGKRCRNWDACIFEGYTREASGNNPRLEKWNRTSRRYEHKLKYDYLANGISGCVGCGRCLASCPVNIGISQVIEEVAK